MATTSANSVQTSSVRVLCASHNHPLAKVTRPGHFYLTKLLAPRVLGAFCARSRPFQRVSPVLALEPDLDRCLAHVQPTGRSPRLRQPPPACIQPTCAPRSQRRSAPAKSMYPRIAAQHARALSPQSLHVGLLQ